MKKYDVWLYCVTVEANSETEAEIKVNDALDRALQLCISERDKEILSGIQVDYAEEIRAI